MICYVSQGYGVSRLTGPWRHKPRPPWRLSANPDAWHGPNRPMGAIQELWMAMICFHRGQFQSCGISMDEKNVSRRGWTEQERIRLLPSHITSSHSRNNKAFFFFNEMYLKRFQGSFIEIILKHSTPLLKGLGCAKVLVRVKNFFTVYCKPPKVCLWCYYHKLFAFLLKYYSR